MCEDNNLEMMKFERLKSAFVLVVSYLFILLFVYASVSKGLDYDKFQVQLGQSPLFAAYADFVAWFIPLVELIVVVLLFYKKLRLYGLYGSFMLMTMFTTYIYLILNYSNFIPCSCGGILEKMTWGEHFYFNIVFTALASLAIFFHKTLYHNSEYKTVLFKIGVLLSCGFVGVFSVVLVYKMSEKSIQYTNKFIRQFPPHFADEVSRYNLVLNSYYIAGIENETLFLGNVTAPLHVMLIDTSLSSNKEIAIKLFEKDLPFKRPQLKVFKTSFYLFEGSIPYIFQGSLTNWNAYLQLKSGLFFSQLVPLDSIRNSLRYIDPKTGEHLIGVNYIDDLSRIKISNDLLQKQIDGIFDTDGTLMYNETLNVLIYVHRYRNEFTVFNPELELKYRGKTIDTISKAVIKLKDVNSNSIKTFAEPPLIVNKSCSTYGNFLFINSLLRGQYENEIDWKNASIVDVYDLVKNRYLLSFYVYNIGHSKMKGFCVKGNHLYAMVGNYLVKYQLRNEYLNKINESKNIPAGSRVTIENLK